MATRFVEQWPRVDERGLASFVSGDVGSGIGLGLDRKAQESTVEGRRAIVAAIYEALRAKGIRYVSEPYHPSASIQRIRTSSEIFADREGTCLDLALLFCGVCLHFDLLPYVIVFEDHAIAAVSATSLLAEWNGIRPGYMDFAGAPLTDVAKLHTLVQQGALIPVECTGFAASEYLMQAGQGARTAPETVGRVDGVMRFERALEAGMEQIDRAQAGGARALRFALDIAIAQYQWRMPLVGVVSQAPQEKLGPSLRAEVENFIGYYLGSARRPAPFGGRSDALQRLNDWIAGDVPYGVVLAPAGKGKSALLVRWVTELRALQQGTHVVFFPISVRYQTNQAVPALRTIAESLAECNDEPPPESTEIAQLRSAIKRLLQQAPPDGRSLLLVIDGLDEAAHWTIDRNLLPASLPEKVKILLATRPLGGDANHSGMLAQLGLPRITVAFFPLAALSREGVVEVVRGLGGQLATRDQSSLATRLFELSEGDPLLLRLYLDEINVAGATFERMWQQLTGLDVGIDGYMRLWCAEQAELRQVNPLEDRGARTLLELCAHAFGPLASADITMLGGEELATSAAIQRAVPLVDRLLLGDGRSTGYVFSHPRLADYIRGLVTPQEERAWERRFLDYGRSTLAGLHDGSLQAADISPYLLRYLFAHLLRNAPQELESLLSIEWMRAWEERSGAVSGFVDDVNLVWEEARKMGEAGLMMQIKAALYSSSLASTVMQVPGVVLQAALRNELVSPIKALSLARRHTSADRRCHCLAVTIPFIPEEEKREELWEEWVELLRKVPTLEGVRTGCLRHHVDQIPARFTPQVMEVIRQTGERESRIGMYCWMLRRLTGEELQHTLDRIVEEIEGGQQLQYLYPQALPIVPEEHLSLFLDRALAYARTYGGPPENRPGIMAVLVRATQGAERERFLQLTLDMILQSGLRARYKAWGLMEILPLMEGPFAEADQKMFLDWTTDLDSHQQTDYIRLLADKLTEPVVSEEWFYLRMSTDDIDQDGWAALALRREEPARSEEFRKAWDAICARTDAEGLQQLAFIFARVPEEWKDELRTEAMTYLRKSVGAFSIDSVEDFFFDFYAHHPQEIYGMVIRNLGLTFSTPWVFQNAQRFHLEHERELVRVAWEKSRRAYDGPRLLHTLASILPQLPEKERRTVADFILKTPHGHDLEDYIFPVLQTLEPEELREWLRVESTRRRGDIAIQMAKWQTAAIREQLEGACISRSVFGQATQYELPDYGIDASVAVDPGALVKHVSAARLPDLMETLITWQTGLKRQEILEVITIVAPRLEAREADRLADWFYVQWSLGDEEEKGYNVGYFHPLLASMSRGRRDELVAELLAFIPNAQRVAQRSMLQRLLPYLSEEQMAVALEMVGSYAISPVRLAGFLREIGERLPETSAARYLERCEELSDMTYVFLKIEMRSALVKHMSAEDKAAFVREMRAPALDIRYVRDRVDAVRYLCRFCDAETQRELWQQLVGTEEQEVDYLSSGDLGITASPRSDLFEAVAEMGPSWLLLRCLEAAVGHESSHSNGVVKAVLDRWPEVRAFGRSEEIRGLTMVLRHGVAQGRGVLLENLTRVSVSLTTEQCCGFAVALQDVAQIIE